MESIETRGCDAWLHGARSVGYTRGGAGYNFYVGWPYSVRRRSGDGSGGDFGIFARGGLKPWGRPINQG